MNLKTGKVLKAGVSAALTAVMVLNMVLGTGLEVKAADTLSGVQKLIDEVSANSQQGRKYTILELVGKESDAEIGYLFDGYEPALSSRDSATGKWENWKAVLGKCKDKAERETKFSALKTALESKLGSSGERAAEAVSGSSYEEKDSAATGFERIDFGTETKKGYFSPNPAGTYNLNFRKASDPKTAGNVYYSSSLTEITDGTDPASVGDSEFVYHKEGDSYIYMGQWKDVKDGIQVSTMSLFSMPVARSLPGNNVKSQSPGESASQGDSVNSDDGTSGSDGKTQPGSGNNDDVKKQDDSAKNGGSGAATPVSPVSSGFVSAGAFHFLAGSLPAPAATKTFRYQPDYFYGEFKKDDTAGEYEVSFIKKENSGSVAGAYDFKEDAGGQDYAIDNGFIYTNSYFKNNEWFKKYVLNMEPEEYDAFPVEVVTCTYSELNSMAVPEFDFLYINGSPSADLNESVANGIFSRVLNNNLPCIVDGDILYSAGAACPNLYKLCTMLGQKILNGDDQSRTADALFKAFPDTVAGKTYATGQTFVLKQGTFLVNKDFSKKISDPKDFKSVVESIEMENLYRSLNKVNPLSGDSAEVTFATVIRHIMNYKNMKGQSLKKTLSVLEIHPADSGRELSLIDIQKWAPMIEEVGVGSEEMGTAEFNSKNMMLNDQYDLIYIGASTESLNVDAGKKPVYNNGSLNSYYYHSTGDVRKNNGDWYYSGNDITEEKKNQLLHYLKGNYPVIVSENVKAEPDSNMQAFLNEAKNYKNFYIKKDLTEDFKPFQFYLNQPKVEISSVTTNGDGDAFAGYNKIPLQNGVYRSEGYFTLNQSGIVPADVRYQCRLRTDLNGDGKYTDDELIGGYQILLNGTPVDAASLVPGQQYVLVKDFPSNYKGLISWSMEVSLVSNPSVCDSLNGFTQLLTDKPEKINILQLCEDGDKVLNLSAALAEENKDGLFYKLIHSLNQGYDIDITYCSLKDYQDRILGNKEDNIIADPDFLKDYNMLLFGVSNGTLDISGDQLLNPIREYMNAGKSVLFTRSAWDLKEKLKPSGAYTYTYINSQTPTDGTNKYLNLNRKSLLDGDRRTVENPLLSRTNAGIYSNYPFYIGDDIQVGSAVGGTYQMNSADSTAWYCIDKTVDKNGASQPTAFSVSPDDGVNNYYLYSQGNVVCSGFTGTGTEKELQLFVNTIIATYHAGLKSPTVDFLKDSRKDSPKISAMYRYFDGDGDLDSTGTEKIYFRVKDTNFAATELKLPCSFLYQVGNTGVKALPCSIKDASSQAVVGATDSRYYLENDHLYYMEVSKDILKQCDKGLNLYIDAQSQFKLANRPCETEVVREKLEVIKAYLWDLR